MNSLEAINNRRSIRKYLEKPVEFEKITTILDAARKAPSAGNLQEWRFIIATDKNLIKDVSEYSLEQYWIQTAPLLIIVCSESEQAEAYYGLRGKRLYAVQDCAAAIENMLIAATDLGLGSCWVGAFEEDKLRAAFAIPPEVRPQAIVALGYADETPQERSLSPIENMVFFNRYGMKIEKLHIVMRDYAVEWQRLGGRLKNALKNTGRKIREQARYISEKFRRKPKQPKEEVRI